MKSRSLPVERIEPREAGAWKRKVPPIRFRPGQVLFYRGHLPYGIMIIHSGSADLRLREGDLRTHVRVGPCTVLGLSNLLNEQPYPRTAVVVETLEASFVEKTRILSWVKDRNGEFLLRTPPPTG
jgi:CRP-like cAMP-binding protein